MAAYGTDEGFNDYISAQGLTLPDDAPSVEVLRTLGSAYVDSAYEYKLQCSRRTGGFEQELAWPRTGHKVNGQNVPSDLIPPAWVKASYRAAYLNAVTPGWSTAGEDVSPKVKRQKVEGIEREFFGPNATVETSAAPGMPSDSIINGMLTPWLCASVRNLNSLFKVI